MNTLRQLSILRNVTKADLVLEPYPHLILENALETELFAELERTFPEDSLIMDGRPVQDTWYEYSAFKVLSDERISPVWRDFFRYHTSEEFFGEFVALFGGAIRTTHPDLELRMNRKLEKFRVGMRPGGRKDPMAPDADVSMDCQFYVNYTHKPRIVRGPHVDDPKELFAALLYFRQAEDTCIGGNLQICEPISDLYTTKSSVRIDALPAEVSASRTRIVREAPYRPNTLVLFLNCPQALHSVAARSATPLTRRHVNFCGEVAFDLFEIEYRARLRLKRALESTPVAWRLAQYL